MPSPVRKVGAKVQLDGEKEYREALENLNAANRVLSTEMQKLQAEYKGNTESTEYLTKAGKLLEQQLLSQQEKVSAIRARYEEAVKTLGESNTQTMQLKAALNKAETAEIDFKNAIEENNAALQAQGKEMAGLGDTVDQLASKLGIQLPDSAKNALNGMQGLSAGTVAAMAATAGAIAAVAKVVKELGELTLQVAAEVDDYLTESEITGVPTEMLQAWDYAAPLIDVDADTIKDAMTKITRSMGDAASGSEASQAAFENLGVSITDDVTGQLRPAEEVFYDIVDALGQVQNQTERDALAMDLMGKSAQELNPLINQGSAALKGLATEAKATGFVLDEYQIQRLAEVDDAYQRLQLTIAANKRQLAAEFAPAAKAAMELFSDVVQKAGEMLERSGLIQNLASIIESLVSILRSGGDILSGLPIFNRSLDAVKVTLGAIAQFAALIADAADVIAGIFQVITGSGDGRKAGLERIGNAMGFGKSSGTLSHWQTVYMQQEGTLSQYQEYYANKNGGTTYSGYGYDPSVGYYDEQTGNIIGWDIGRNAGGSDAWRGGLTWVGEGGPELVSLPRGSRIEDAQESAELMGGDTFIINASVQDLEDLQTLINFLKSTRVRSRMR